MARSLGIEQVAVVISKLDCCDDRAEGRFEEICAVMAPFLKTCGFKVGFGSRCLWMKTCGFKVAPVVACVQYWVG